MVLWLPLRREPFFASGGQRALGPLEPHLPDALSRARGHASEISPEKVSLNIGRKFRAASTASDTSLWKGGPGEEPFFRKVCPREITQQA